MLYFIFYHLNRKNFCFQLWPKCHLMKIEFKIKWRKVECWVTLFSFNYVGWLLDIIDQNSSSDIIKTTLELNWRQSSTSSLELEFSYVSIDFTGTENSPIEFEMLQGLKNGNNLLWRLNYIHRISNNIEMLVNYMGRKSENNSAINTASVQMRAIF